MTTNAAAPGHPWRACRTWCELRRHSTNGEPTEHWMASTDHHWATELDARAGAQALSAGRDLPDGCERVEVALERWEPKVARWREVTVFAAGAEVSR